MRLFDLHCDTLGLGYHHGASIEKQDGSIDLCRGAVFNPWIQAFAAFLPDGLTPAEAWQEYIGLRDTARCWEREYPGAFRSIHSSQDIDSPRVGCHCMLTVENAGVLGSDLTRLDRLATDGVWMAGLTWNGDNPWASGCGGDQHGGLTTVGRRAVERLECLEITVDVSHLNETGFWQVAHMVKRPIVASHSNAYTVCPHPRNLTDDQFRAIRDSGGLVGINLYPPFLGGDDLPAVERHIAHFAALNGEKTLCFGADFDGMTPPREWNGLTVMTKIGTYLLECGYTLDFLEDLFYNNAYRFFHG